MAGPDRLERLTDLVLVLLRSSRPRTLEEIAVEVPGYPTSHDARRQAFERDKRLLRDEGIPVLTEPVEGPEQFGYRIDPDAFYLPDLGLGPDEQAALHLAVAGVHLGDPSGRDALLKLGAAGVADVRPVASVVPPKALVPLFDAVRNQARVELGYRGEPRQVVPTGLRFRGGRWYLVGWDTGRRGARTFRVDRIDTSPVSGPPGSGRLPEGAVVDAGPDEPWRVGDELDDDVLLVRVDAVEADRVVGEVGEVAVQDRAEDGSVLLRLGVAGAEALRSWVLGLLDHAEVVGPPAARAAMVAWLSAIAEAPPDGLAPPAPDGLAPPAPDGTSFGNGGATLAGDLGRPDPNPPAGPSGAGDRDRRPSPQGASARLRRLLAIVGWLARVGEAPIAEIAERFGLPPDRVVHELELAACCGLPPYSPDMLLEIVVTDDTVQAFLPPEMARPRRLTAAEGLALAASARTILAVPGADRDGALARALTKLAAVLGDQQRLVVDLDRPALLDDVRSAVDAGVQAEIEYHSASTDETTRRVVEPLAVVSLEGHWYLDALCHRSQGVRRFRVDRIRSLDRLALPVEGRPTHEAGRPQSFVPGPGAVEVRLVLDAAAAWVVDSVPALGTRPLGDGTTEMVLAVGGRAWLERLLLQLGPHARVVSPPELVDAGAAAARRVLHRYGVHNNMK
ncbi:MAG: helix-turn-helix transcriptional regulator [Acidimicrobiales bacterium]